MAPLRNPRFASSTLAPTTATHCRSPRRLVRRVDEEAQENAGVCPQTQSSHHIRLVHWDSFAGLDPAEHRVRRPRPAATSGPAWTTKMISRDRLHVALRSLFFAVRCANRSDVRGPPSRRRTVATRDGFLDGVGETIGEEAQEKERACPQSQSSHDSPPGDLLDIHAHRCASSPSFSMTRPDTPGQGRRPAVAGVRRAGSTVAIFIRGRRERPGRRARAPPSTRARTSSCFTIHG
jgi:hypothetical protein